MGQRKRAPVFRFHLTAAVRAWRAWMPGALLAAMVAIAFAPAIDGGWVLDDDVYITANPHLRSVDGLAEIWLRPLAHSSLPDRYALLHTMFWVEYQVWGLSPLGFHAVNIALHAACVVLLWRLLLQLKVSGAWLAAAVFAVHPICVESVAWVTEGKNTLSMLFALAAMLCYLRFAPAEASNSIAETISQAGTPLESGGGSGNWQYYAFSLVLFAAALLSKTQVVVLPAILLVVCWWKRGRIRWCDVKPLLAFFALAALMGSLTVYAETQFNGASGASYSRSLLERLLIAGQATWFYVGKLIWPHPLVFIYPRWTIDATAWSPFAYGLAAIAVLAALWFSRNKIGRGPLAATFVFIGLLFPILGLFNVCFHRFSFVADHFQYHAAAAMLTLITAVTCTLVNRVASTRSLATHGYLKIAGGIAAAGVLGTFTLLSQQQCKLYASAETLYADTVAKNPDCWLAHGNLANELKSRGQHAAAMEHYREAIRLHPSNAEAHVNLGTTLACTGRIDEAVAEFQATIQLMPVDAAASGAKTLTFAAAYNGLGAAFDKLGKPESARESFEQSVRLNSNLADAQFNLGTSLLKAGKTDSAIEHFRRAVQLNPEYAEAHGNLGAALATAGHLDQAILAYREAIRLNPEFSQAQYNLGLALLGAGKTVQAIAALKAALLLNRNDVQCAFDLATAYHQAGRTAEALEAADRAGKLAQSNGHTAANRAIQAWIAKARRSSTISPLR